MNIKKLIAVAEDDVARVYEWPSNPLTFEELISFLQIRGKLNPSKWLEKADFSEKLN